MPSLPPRSSFLKPDSMQAKLGAWNLEDDTRSTASRSSEWLTVNSRTK